MIFSTAFLSERTTDIPLIDKIRSYFLNITTNVTQKNVCLNKQRHKNKASQTNVDINRDGLGDYYWGYRNVEGGGYHAL